jgi:hypothetical protein
MKIAVHNEVIDVQALRVGMFVHLDVGWMSHPFPLSSFRITTPAQVATIRSLGLQRVRWSPEQSEPEPVEEGDQPLPTLPAANDANLATPDGASPDDGATPDEAAEQESWNAPPGTFDAAAVSAEARSAADRKRQLDAQREAQKICERQYVEASRSCRQTIELVPSRPRDAAAQAQTLTKAIVDKMLGEQDLCIRMLTEAPATRPRCMP